MRSNSAVLTEPEQPSLLQRFADRLRTVRAGEEPASSLTTRPADPDNPTGGTDLPARADADAAAHAGNDNRPGEAASCAPAFSVTRDELEAAFRLLARTLSVRFRQQADEQRAFVEERLAGFGLPQARSEIEARLERLERNAAENAARIDALAERLEAWSAQSRDFAGADRVAALGARIDHLDLRLDGFAKASPRALPPATPDASAGRDPGAGGAQRGSSPSGRPGAGRPSGRTWLSGLRSIGASHVPARKSGAFEALVTEPDAGEKNGTLTKENLLDMLDDELGWLRSEARPGAAR